MCRDLDSSDLDKCGDDGLHCHGDHVEAVRVVLLQHVSAHERED